MIYIYRYNDVVSRSIGGRLDNGVGDSIENHLSLSIGSIVGQRNMLRPCSARVWRPSGAAYPEEEVRFGDCAGCHDAVVWIVFDVVVEDVERRGVVGVHPQGLACRREVFVGLPPLVSSWIATRWTGRGWTPPSMTSTTDASSSIRVPSKPAQVKDPSCA